MLAMDPCAGRWKNESGCYGKKFHNYPDEIHELMAIYLLFKK